jgi:hypothetical protein
VTPTRRIVVSRLLGATMKALDDGEGSQVIGTFGIGFSY